MLNLPLPPCHSRDAAHPRTLEFRWKQRLFIWLATKSEYCSESFSQCFMIAFSLKKKNVCLMLHLANSGKHTNLLCFKGEKIHDN